MLRASRLGQSLLNRSHHISFTAVFLDEPAEAVAALAGAFGAFDAKQLRASSFWLDLRC